MPGRPSLPPARRSALRGSASSRVSPSAAATARPFLVLVPIIPFLLPALLIALVRTPVHTSEARLLVGGFDVEAQAVPGFVEASRTLAATYARLVTTPAVVDAVATALEQSPETVAGHLGATSVPEASIIRVEGTASTPARSQEYADAAATALLEYASGTGGDTAETALKAYQEASAALSSAQSTVARLAQAIEGSPGSADLLRQFNQAQAAEAAAKLRADSLAERYRAKERNVGNSGQVRLVAPATYVGSDRRSKLQLAIAAPVVFGLIVGLALATFVVNRDVARGRGAGRDALA